MACELLEVMNIQVHDEFSIAQAHNDLLRTYEAKFTQFGIPIDELGFKPLDATLSGQVLGQGPAGLVSAPS